jgi:hypothetical protein
MSNAAAATWVWIPLSVVSPAGAGGQTGERGLVDTPSDVAGKSVADHLRGGRA